MLKCLEIVPQTRYRFDMWSYLHSFSWRIDIWRFQGLLLPLKNGFLAFVVFWFKDESMLRGAESNYCETKQLMKSFSRAGRGMLRSTITVAPHNRWSANPEQVWERCSFNSNSADKKIKKQWSSARVLVFSYFHASCVGREGVPRESRFLIQRCSY